jgi:hypothetical protein
MAIRRNVNLSASRAAPAPVAPKVTKPLRLNISAAKPKARVALVEAEPPKNGRAAAPRIVHNVDSLYDGGSKGLNARKSGTKLDLSLFNTKPDMVLTSRTELVLQSIKNQYQRATFARGNIDAGVLKYGIMKGHLKPVSGDGGETTMLQFTPTGMAYSAGRSKSRRERVAA